ncbi:hypothetical protein [Aminipila terrae]|uniref:Uncharacterized protein n=1 Tax=Aminipila terrae TaxID=2697030 RepID=A0A6P1M9B3_9FIRM|nr:hypothetical protein [Aminipila terrae]QHI71319.1 hypothetical protein Ami3637_01920 [Aminipila terrae]
MWKSDELFKNLGFIGCGKRLYFTKGSLHNAKKIITEEIFFVELVKYFTQKRGKILFAVIINTVAIIVGSTERDCF